jgi:hypothetical protein
MREPALAIMMGVLGSGGAPPGTHFGYETGYGFGIQHGMQQPGGFSNPHTQGFGFGAGGPGGPPGGGAFGGFAHPSMAMGGHPGAFGHHLAAGAHGGPNAYHQSMHHAMQNPGSTEARTHLLDPNRDSTVKVERYSFSFSPAASLLLGTSSSIANFSKNPSTSVKVDRVVANVAIPMMVTLSQLQVANVNVFVGGTEDAYTYNPNAQNILTETPRLDPQNSATSAGNYTGALPPGFSSGTSVTFVLTLQGASTMAGGFTQ